MGFVLKQPSEYLVYLSTAVPALMPVNSPALFTVAIPLFEEFQTPLVSGETWPVLPTHTKLSPPKTGSAGIPFISTVSDGLDTQRLLFVMVKVKLLDGGRLVTVKLFPVPLYVIPPGILVNVQLPDDGNSLISTLPDWTIHVGWVVMPITGVSGSWKTVNGNELLQPSDVLV